jgi:hypothetical protein
MDKFDINLKEYFVGQSGGYGGQKGGSIAANGWAGTYSSPQTSNRLNLHPDTGITSYMQGNTIVRNALPDTILPQDLEGTPYDPDEIRLGLRSEMKRQEFPDKTKAKQTVIDNLSKNPKFYSDLSQYMNLEKGELMENIDQSELKMGMDVEREHTQDDALAMKIAMDHLKEDPRYYSKLSAAGLGHGDEPMARQKNVVSVTLASPVSIEPKQSPLSSSGLGSCAPKVLKSTNLTAPEASVINNKNTVASTKTPAMIQKADPINHFIGQMQKGM